MFVDRWGDDSIQHLRVSFVGTAVFLKVEVKNQVFLFWLSEFKTKSLSKDWEPL